MMTEQNPALSALVSAIGEGMTFAQVHIAPAGAGWVLRHTADVSKPAETLKPLAGKEIRAWVQTTEGGAFRPIKTAPSLRPGFVVMVKDAVELEEALSHFYPGALVDWWAAALSPQAAVEYRAFSKRQTGMYRIMGIVPTDLAQMAAESCCGPKFCLKRRMWTVDGNPGDAPEQKSVIPCLEPCAVMMEFARKAMKIEKEDNKISLNLAPSDLETILQGLEAVLESQETSLREGDVAAALNPRRVALLHRKLAGFRPPPQEPEEH